MTTPTLQQFIDFGWRRVRFFGTDLNGWLSPDDLAPLPDGFVWAQIDSDGPFRACQLLGDPIVG